MKGEVRISHCIVDGEIRSVTDFSETPISKRPASYCPECNGPLVLKLGRSGKVAHHAAHKGDAVGCSLSTGEGALHFNTKMYMYEQLNGGTNLYLKQMCGGWSIPDRNGNPGAERRSCQNHKVLLWVSDWENVQIEMKLGSTRPDLVLLGKGKPIAAIEIFATHSVDEIKRQKFLDANIPWLEVKADGGTVDEYFVEWLIDYETDEFPWKINKPLTYHRCFPEPEVWVCQSCLKAPELFLERRAEAEMRYRLKQIEKANQKRSEAEQKKRYLDRQDNKILFAKAFEFIKWGERKRYDLFVIRRDSPEPAYEPQELYLKNGKYGIEIMYSEMPITEDSEQRVKQVYREWFDAITEHAINLQQITRGWVSEVEYERITSEYDNSLQNLLKNIERS